MKQFEHHLYKIILKGKVEDGVIFHPEEIKAKLDMLYYVKIKDSIEIEVDYRLLAKEHTLKGMFVQRMLSKMSEAEQSGKYDEVRRYKEGLQIGLKAFSSEVKYYEDY